MYDLIIIGGGPSGLAAALSAKRLALNYLLIERGVVAETIHNYPIAKRLFSTSNEVELESYALPREAKPSREEVIAHYENIVARERLNIHTNEEARSIIPLVNEFRVVTNRAEYEAHKVLVAIGGFGRQRKLNVPGETPLRVSYRFVEASPFAQKAVLIVGGGNSAAEAALFLAQAGAKVSLSLRRPSLDGFVEMDSVGLSTRTAAVKIKPWVRDPLERAASEGKIAIYTSSQIVEILPHSALLCISGEESHKIIEVECDHIFALIGADPDTRLLEAAGVEIAADGRPVYSPDSFETNLAGLYVAGHLTRELHMKKAIEVGRRVVEHIASKIYEESYSMASD
ncbi:MAG TPA: NAD(P)-binding domain-containing protein [Blastocatellia bacterium]|nr:NAD(P)-binding domain-containing protein [Blastocatellia bacterium]